MYNPISRCSTRWSFSPEFTQNIPPKGAHLIRYYGEYSNKARGMRRKAAEAATQAAPAPKTSSRCAQTWAMRIKRVYEVDPLCCPKCQAEMNVAALIERPQTEVIKKLLKHCGLQHPDSPSARAPSTDGTPSSTPDGELTYVPIDGFLATF